MKVGYATTLFLLLLSVCATPSKSLPPARSSGVEESYSQSIPIETPQFHSPAEITSPHILFQHAGPSDGCILGVILVAEATHRFIACVEEIVIPSYQLNAVDLLAEAAREQERWPVSRHDCDFEQGAFDLTTSGIGTVPEKSSWRLSRSQAEALFRRLAAQAKAENMAPALQNALERILSIFAELEQEAGRDRPSQMPREEVPAPRVARSMPGAVEGAH